MSPYAKILRWLRARLRDQRIRYINFYPPYLGAAVQVTDITPDYRSIRVRMPLTFYNRNLFGTHFGGSLYAMCDPFFVLMVLKNLGDAYIAWDKEAHVRFVRPGRGTVHAHFALGEADLHALRSTADRDGKAEALFSVDVVDDAGEIVARVDKHIHVRRKTRP